MLGSSLILTFVTTRTAYLSGLRVGRYPKEIPMQQWLLDA